MTKLLQSYWKFYNLEPSKEERRERQENRSDNWSRQAATVAAAGCGEAGRREPERESGAENRGGGGRGGGALRLELSAAAAASAIMGAAAANQRAPPLSIHVVNAKWATIHGSFRQAHTQAHAHGRNNRARRTVKLWAKTGTDVPCLPSICFPLWDVFTS